jgi:hypothetical protein
MAPIDVVFVYNKSNPYGIARDVQIMEEALLKVNSMKDATTGKTIKRFFGKSRHLDMREPPSICDVQFHFEIPVYANCPWATINILLVNPEQFIYDAYAQYASAFQYIMCRDKDTVQRFIDLGVNQEQILYVPWAIKPLELSKLLTTNNQAGFVSFIGGSNMKCGAVCDIINSWPSTGPALKIFTTRPDFEKILNETLKGGGMNEKITVECKDIPKSERDRLQVYYPGHVLVSHAEGFGYAASEAEAAGAFLLMNNIPVYKDSYENVSSEHIGWLSSTFEDISGGYMAKKGCVQSNEAVKEELAAALTAFSKSCESVEAVAANKKFRQLRCKARWENFLTAFHSQMKPITDQFSSSNTSPIRRLPPFLQNEDCPYISIITLTYNRRVLFDLAAYNLLLTDYPRDKIEWIVVEDSDDQALAASDKIIKFAADHPEFRVSYVPLEKKMTIGEKRNKGVEHAKYDICLFMDDDDYYPETSVRRRVAWLTQFKVNCVATTMLAMYDLMKGTSAVNVPPWNIPLRKRISEASLTFRRSFWEDKKFTATSSAEGEEWLAGRENQVLEIPPQQIIVALSHTGNASGRRIPGNDSRPGCFWGWPKELIIFLHGLAGVKVEEDTSSVPNKKK